MLLSFEDLGPKLTKEDILRQVSEEAIYKRFCKEFPSRSMPSPFREDKNPSFGFYKGTKGNMAGKWLWKDLGGNGDGGDVFEFIMKDQRTDFNGALQLIAKAFHITTAYRNDIIIRDRFSKQAANEAGKRSRTLIQVVRRDITQKEYEWWNRILLTPTLLEFYLMRAAKEVWVDKKLFWFHKAENPIYYFLSPVSKNVKCYRPLEPHKKRKWLSNQDPLRDIQGYHQCMIKQRPGRPLLLVNSLKTAAFFRAFHINAMANTGEHVHFDPDFIRHIKKYCYPIIYLGDNDWPGMRATIKHEKRTDIPGIIIPRKWATFNGKPASDPPDLWLANYRKVYDLLNLIYDYIQLIRATGSRAVTPRELRHS